MKLLTIAAVVTLATPMLVLTGLALIAALANI